MSSSESKTPHQLYSEERRADIAAMKKIDALYNYVYGEVSPNPPKGDTQCSPNPYMVDVSKYDKLDVYLILKLYNVTDPVMQHIVKKALCTGRRGHKDFLEDVYDIKKSIDRRIEMHIEESLS